MMYFERMYPALLTLENEYPDQVKINVLGTSADKREIWEVKIGEEYANNHILIHGAIHGREYMNTELLFWMMHTYLKNIKQEEYEQVCFHILPMANPDGVCISHEGPDAIRDRSLQKTIWECYKRDLEEKREFVDAEMYFKKWKANARGVDLNKNFLYGWKEYQGKIYPSYAFYKGEMPGSEEETKAILKIAKMQKFCCTVAFHSSGNLVYWDYGSTGKVFKQEKRLAQLIHSLTGYPILSTIEQKTEKAGCSDYFVRCCSVPSVTIETGSAECPLPEKELSVLKEKCGFLLCGLANYYGRNRDKMGEKYIK